MYSLNQLFKAREEIFEKYSELAEKESNHHTRHQEVAAMSRGIDLRQSLYQDLKSGTQTINGVNVENLEAIATTELLQFYYEAFQSIQYKFLTENSVLKKAYRRFLAQHFDIPLHQNGVSGTPNERSNQEIDTEIQEKFKALQEQHGELVEKYREQGKLLAFTELLQQPNPDDPDNSASCILL